jgi:hypothetical protein
MILLEKYYVLIFKNLTIYALPSSRLKLDASLRRGTGLGGNCSGGILTSARAAHRQGLAWP